MKKFLSGLRGKTLLFTFMTAAVLMQTACHPRINKGGGPPTNHVSNWINWNFVFKEGTDSATRAATIASITNQIRNVSSDTTKRPTTQRPNVSATGIRYSPDINSYLTSYLQTIIKKANGFSLNAVEVHFCSCHDSLLWNLTSDLSIGGSGQSAPNSPPPPGPGPSGDAVLTVDSNGAVTSPSTLPPLIDPTGLFTISGNPEVVDTVVLGIIDTGIDPDLFSAGLYHDVFASGGIEPVNFVPTGPSTDFKDTDPVKHGSSVAAITLNAFHAEALKDGKARIPKLLALRALDGTGMGNTFSVSCAMSYAIRHKVKLINASLGYWNAQNTVINHYLQLSARHHIPVVAAAGNEPGQHTLSLCETGLNPHNLLRPGNMFYPACQSIDSLYCIISVTGLSSPEAPCRYQNYSSRYISVGVVNKDTSNSCCGFSLSFINKSYQLDGSSFATPVISGELGYQIMLKGRQNNPASYVDLLNTKKTTHNFLTWSGQYITY